MRIARQIGPNFANELAAANLVPGPLQWTAQGVTILPSATAAQVTAIQAVIDAHDADRPDIKAQIAQIERENPITPRALREFIIGVCTAANVDMNTTAGLRRVAQVEAEIVALRAQMR